VIALLSLVACDPAPEDIAKAIGSENPVVREDGAKIAQNYDDEVVVKALEGVLADPSEKVRLNAIESLAEIGAASAAPALIARLREDASPKVRRSAADALGRLLAKDAAADLVTTSSRSGRTTTSSSPASGRSAPSAARGSRRSRRSSCSTRSWSSGS